jgi:hypothetical protein
MVFGFIVFYHLSCHFPPESLKVYWIDVHIGDATTSIFKPVSLTAHIDEQIILLRVATK